MSKKNVDVINLILKESKAYTSLEVIENFIQEKKSLESLPVQPLYTTFKNLPVEIKSHAMSLLSKEQREVFYDLDLWKKDTLDIPSFSEMVKTISKSPDENLRYEFSRSSEFALFIKGRFNTWTFDVEDPLYPDHDYYFLTEDNLLLFEYDEDCEIVDEVKQLIKDIYSELGVEKAYQYIFTVVSDGFISLSENEYEKKKERLKHFGFVDYIEALQITNSFPSLGHVDLFISKKEMISAEIDELERNQTLHANSLIAFEENELNISNELAKIEDSKRYDYLHFNFIRLVNANLEKNDAIKDGAMTMTRIGKIVRNHLELGFSYIKANRDFTDDESIFDYFDFVDVYRVGSSLLTLVQKSVKKELAAFELDTVDDNFLGQYFEDFLDGLFASDIKVSTLGELHSVVHVDQFKRLRDQSELLIQFLPFAMTFKKNLMSLISEGQINDDFYLNYSSESIDIEAILMSLIINFSLGKLNAQTPKMGVTIAELKTFHHKFFKNQSLIVESIDGLLEDFISNFGLREVNHLKPYIVGVMMAQMNDYEVDRLEDHEFKHIGGPILLNNLS